MIGAECRGYNKYITNDKATTLQYLFVKNKM